jgi:RNA-binding protein Tab2/Atab2
MVDLHTPLTSTKIASFALQEVLRSSSSISFTAEISAKIEQLQSFVQNRLMSKSLEINAALMHAVPAQGRGSHGRDPVFATEQFNQDSAHRVQEQEQEIHSQLNKDERDLSLRPIPENLWGNGWHFTEVRAEELEHQLLVSPIPYRKVSPSALPSQQDIPLREFVPGIIIEAGKQSMQLASWIKKHQPTSFEVLKKDRGALVLNTLDGRWLMPTYQNKAVQEASKAFEAHKRKCSGIHFLLVQQDGSGQSISGLWILKQG